MRPTPGCAARIAGCPASLVAPHHWLPRVQVAVAAALIIAAVCATGCVGVTCGKCWLKQQRAKAISDKQKKEEERLKLQPAYEYRQGGAARPGEQGPYFFLFFL